jgi:hypothetical protein
MGINTHYYTVYGVHVNEYDDELSDALYGEGDLYKLFENGTLPEDFGLIMDGMGGNYMVLGKILFDSGDLRYNDFEDTFVEVNLGDLTKFRLEYTEQFMNYFPSFGHYLDREWKLMTFMHLS